MPRPIRILLLAIATISHLACSTPRPAPPHVDDVRRALVLHFQHRRPVYYERFDESAAITPMNLPALARALPSVSFYRTTLTTNFFEYPRVETAIAAWKTGHQTAVSINLSPTFADADASFLEVFKAARADSPETRPALATDIAKIFAAITHNGAVRGATLDADLFKAQLWHGEHHWRNVIVTFHENRVASVALANPKDSQPAAGLDELFAQIVQTDWQTQHQWEPSTARPPPDFIAQVRQQAEFRDIDLNNDGISEKILCLNFAPGQKPINQTHYVLRKTSQNWSIVGELEGYPEVAGTAPTSAGFKPLVATWYAGGFRYTTTIYEFRNGRYVPTSSDIER